MSSPKVGQVFQMTLEVFIASKLVWEFSMFFSKIFGKFSPRIFLMGKNFLALWMGENFPQLSSGHSKRENCLYYVNPSKKIPNQTKIGTKAFKNRPSSPAGIQ